MAANEGRVLEVERLLGTLQTRMNSLEQRLIYDFRNLRTINPDVGSCVVTIIVRSIQDSVSGATVAGCLVTIIDHSTGATVGTGTTNALGQCTILLSAGGTFHANTSGPSGYFPSNGSGSPFSVACGNSIIISGPVEAAIFAWGCMLHRATTYTASESTYGRSALCTYLGFRNLTALFPTLSTSVQTWFGTSSSAFWTGINGCTNQNMTSNFYIIGDGTNPPQLGITYRGNPTGHCPLASGTLVEIGAVLMSAVSWGGCGVFPVNLSGTAFTVSSTGQKWFASGATINGAFH